MEAPVTTRPYLELYVTLPDDPELRSSTLEAWAEEIKAFVEQRLSSILAADVGAWDPSIAEDYFVEIQVMLQQGSLIVTLKHTAASLSFVIATFLGGPGDVSANAADLARAHAEVAAQTVEYVESLTEGQVTDIEGNWSDQSEWSSHLREFDFRIEPAEPISTFVAQGYDILSEVATTGADDEHAQFQWAISAADDESIDVVLSVRHTTGDSEREYVIRITIDFDEITSEVKEPQVSGPTVGRALGAILDCVIIASLAVMIDKAMESRFEARRASAVRDRLKGRAARKLAAIVTMCAARFGLAAVGVDG
jgi:hypothetical protein